MSEIDLRLKCFEILMGSKGYEPGDTYELIDDIDTIVEYINNGKKP